MPGGESFIRQVMIGKNFFRERLGVDIKTGWALDSFGHHAQMPQILKLAGMNSYWFFRGVANLQVPSEFHWQGIDGTKINAFWLPLWLCRRLRLARQSSWIRSLLPPGLRRSQAVCPRQRPSKPGRSRCERTGRTLHGDGWKSSTGAAMRRFVSGSASLRSLKLRSQNASSQVVTGELNPIFQGIYSSRIEVKQWYRSLENVLTVAEKLGSLNNWLGMPFDLATVWRAWEPVTFNQTHDLASGVMVDKVYEDTMRGYEFAKRLGDELINTSLEKLISKIDTRGEGDSGRCLQSTGLVSRRCRGSQCRNQRTWNGCAEAGRSPRSSRSIANHGCRDSMVTAVCGG